MTTYFLIPASHPSLPGHFPAQPVVPGVVILQQVETAFQNWQGKTIVAWPQVKFLQPLLPDNEVELQINLKKNQQAAFKCLNANTVIASGAFEYQQVNKG